MAENALHVFLRTYRLLRCCEPLAEFCGITNRCTQCNDRARGKEQQLLPDHPVLRLTDRMNFVEDDSLHPRRPGSGVCGRKQHYLQYVWDGYKHLTAGRVVDTIVSRVDGPYGLAAIFELLRIPALYLRRNLVDKRLPIVSIWFDTFNRLNKSIGSLLSLVQRRPVCCRRRPQEPFA